jgi:hypothetical protein
MLLARVPTNKLADALDTEAQPERSEHTCENRETALTSHEAMIAIGWMDEYTQTRLVDRPVGTAPGETSLAELLAERIGATLRAERSHAQRAAGGG